MRWIAADVETTGIRPTDKVVEIAWIEVDDDLNILSQASSLINPLMPIPAGASAVHGISNRDVANAPTLDQFMDSMGNPLGHGEVCLIAHNAVFDARYVGPYLPQPFHQLCTLRLARRLWPDADSHKLQALRFMLDLAGGRAHSAEGDLTPLLELAKVMMRDTGYSLYELLELSNLPLPITKMPFGKHKGAALGSLPADYVDWLLYKADNINDDLRAALEAL